MIPRHLDYYMRRARHVPDHITWDEEREAWCAKIGAGDVYEGLWNQDLRIEDFQKYLLRFKTEMPGLRVVAEEHRQVDGGYYDNDYGLLWFTWTTQGEDDDLQAFWEKHGVADLRVQTWGRTHWSIEKYFYEPPTETKLREYVGGWTHSGRRWIETNFCTRILYPNRGGPESSRFRRHFSYANDEIWLTGTRGDSKEILLQEINCSVLDEHVKENLRYNLENYPRDATQRSRLC